MSQPIFQIRIDPNGSYEWWASPGDEIIDPVNDRSIRAIGSGEPVPYAKILAIFRNEDGSLELPEGIWVRFYGEDCAHLTPLQTKTKKVFSLLEPEFSLENIELAEKLVAGDG